MYMMKTQVKLLLLSTLISLTGCVPKEITAEISKVPIEATLLSAAQKIQNSTQDSFPSNVQKEIGNVAFNAPIISGNDVDVRKLTMNSVSYQTVNRELAYSSLFKAVQTVGNKKNASGDVDSYEGSRGESLVVSEGGITFFSDKARPVLRSFHPAKQSERYNIDKYASNKDFDFSTREQALSHILDELSKVGINLGDSYGYACHSLDYGTMKSEEYAIDKKSTLGN